MLIAGIKVDHNIDFAEIDEGAQGQRRLRAQREKAAIVACNHLSFATFYAAD